jgi:hypothetical protein
VLWIAAGSFGAEDLAQIIQNGAGRIELELGAVLESNRHRVGVKVDHHSDGQQQEVAERALAHLGKTGQQRIERLGRSYAL